MEGRTDRPPNLSLSPEHLGVLSLHSRSQHYITVASHYTMQLLRLLYFLLLFSFLPVHFIPVKTQNKITLRSHFGKKKEFIEPLDKI